MASDSTGEPRKPRSCLRNGGAAVGRDGAVYISHRGTVAATGQVIRIELKVYAACNQRTAIQFIDEVLRRLPFRVLVVQTDNGAEFQSQFHWHVETLDIRHVCIRPRTPHLNGKVERSHCVDDQKFYQLLDSKGVTDDIHLFNHKLREWEDYYNYHRPHGALDGQTPYERLLAKTRANVSPES